jgi:hypothetical protein
MNAEYSVEEVRARFEAWARGKGIRLEACPEFPGEYDYPGTQGRWECWQAAYAERIKADEGVVPARGDLDVIRQAIEERDAAMQACDDLAQRMVYKGNSVGWWHSKAAAYRAAIEECWKALGELGIRADGKTHVADVIRTLTAPVNPPAQAAQVDADRIAEETMQAWGDRVPKYSFDFRGLIADGIRRAGIAAGAGTL